MSPRAHAAAIRTGRCRSSSRSRSCATTTGKGRANRHASARICGSSWRSSSSTVAARQFRPKARGCADGSLQTRPLNGPPGDQPSQRSCRIRAGNSGERIDRGRLFGDDPIGAETGEAPHRASSAGTAAVMRRRPTSAARARLSARPHWAAQPAARRLPWYPAREPTAPPRRREEVRPEPGRGGTDRADGSREQIDKSPGRNIQYALSTPFSRRQPGPIGRN